MSTFVHGSFFTHYVFRPGGTAYENIYTDWAQLYAAWQADAPRRSVISFDASNVGGIIDIPAGTYNFGGQTCFEGTLLSSMLLTGGVPVITQVRFAQGTVLTDVRIFRNGFFKSLDPVAPLMTINTDTIVQLDNAEIQNTAGDYFFQINNTFTVFFYARNASIFKNNAVRFQAGSFGIINIEGVDSVIWDPALNIPVGATVSIVPDSSAGLIEPFTTAPGGYGKFNEIAEGYHFRANGQLSLFALNTPIDGQPCVNRCGVLERACLMQRIDSTGAGAGGNTTVNVYRRSDPTTRVQIATGSIPAGSGDNARINMTFSGTVADRTFLNDNQLEIELSAVQTPGATTAPADVTVSVFLQPQ